MEIVLATAIFAVILSFTLGLALGFFSKFFAVPEDPIKAQIRDALPGANCGACGFPGCDGYAAAVAAKTVDINKCPPGGKGLVKKLASIVGGDATVIPKVAVLACQGSKEHAPDKGNYRGLKTCRGSKVSSNGTKLCSWGCMGYGDCAVVCQFGAISMGDDGLPHINYDLCTGCRVCIVECPQQLFIELPKEDSRGALVLCANRNPVKAMIRKTCKVGCIKCELCVKNCPQKCITMDKGIPIVDYSKCVSCGTCIAKCPTKSLKLIESDVITSA